MIDWLGRGDINMIHESISWISFRGSIVSEHPMTVNDEFVQNFLVPRNLDRPDKTSWGWG